ncbi:Atp5hp [Sparganum proliferum]
MASRRVARSAVNWAELYQKCPPHQMEQFRELKTRTDTLVSKISALPEKLPEINWEHYQRIVPIPGLTEKFKKEYMSLTVPVPTDAKQVGKAVDAQAKKMTDAAKKHIVACEKMKSDAQAMKAALNKLPPFEELLPEIVMAYFPHTNIDPFYTGEVPKIEAQTMLQHKAPKVHWDFS